MSYSALKKIMIVDNERPILLNLSQILKTEGVEVIACSAIEEAEAALDCTHFDLVIVDIRMSGVTSIEGLELLSYIRSRFDSKVIIMTDFDNSETRDEAFRRGVHFYLQKPVDITTLIQQVSLAGIPIRHTQQQKSLH